MTIEWSWAFLYVGWALVLISGVLVLGSGPAVPVLLLGLLHLAVAYPLRRRERRSRD